METTLHRQLKEHYSAAVGGLVEQRVGRYRIDVVIGRELVEIQLASLSAIRGKVVARRRSPKQGTVLDVFEELVHFTRVFPHRRLTLEVVLVEIEEWRVPG